MPSRSPYLVFGVVHHKCPEVPVRFHLVRKVLTHAIAHFLHLELGLEIQKRSRTSRNWSPPGFWVGSDRPFIPLLFKPKTVRFGCVLSNRHAFLGTTYGQSQVGPWKLGCTIFPSPFHLGTVYGISNSIVPWSSRANVHDIWSTVGFLVCKSPWYIWCRFSVQYPFSLHMESWIFP